MLDSRLPEDPAEIERSQRRHQMRNLRWVLLCLALLMLGMAVADHLLAPPGDSRAAISLSMGAVALLAYRLLRADRSRWQSALTVAGVMAVTTWSVCAYGSVRAASAFGYLGAVVVAGSYLRLRALVAVTATGVLLLGALTWAEASGHLPPAAMLPDLRYWFMGSVIMLLIGAQLYQTRKTTEDVYLRHLAQVEDRIRLEHERDRSLGRFQRIFQLNPTALLVQSASTRAVLEVNPAFERQFGYPAGQIAGQPIADLWADPAHWQAHCETLFKKGRTDWQPVRWRCGDGRVLDVLVCSELNEDSAGLLILTSAMDAPAVGPGGATGRARTS